MLGFLFGTKKHRANCPICSISLSFKLDKEPPTTEYPHRDDCEYIGDAPCPFCKTVGALIVYNDSGKIRIRDPKWDASWGTYNEKEREISNAIDELQFDLDEDNEEEGLTEKQRASIEKKIEKLQAQLDRLEDSFSDKEFNYDERRERWKEKARKKFGDEAFR